MTRVYLSRFLRAAAAENKEVDRVAKAFKQYKITNEGGRLFGRDAPLDRPASAKLSKLQHVHLLSESSIKSSMRKSGVRVLELMDPYYLRSDAFVIYCQSFIDENRYLLLDILWRDAHRQANDNNRMIDYAEEAEKFK